MTYVYVYLRVETLGYVYEMVMEYTTSSVLPL